jgi:hypothetical protein
VSSQVRDTFTDTAGIDLAAHVADSGHTWSNLIGIGTMLVTPAGRIRFGVASAVIYRSSAPPALNGGAYVDLVRLTALDQIVGVAGRLVDAANLLFARIAPSGPTWQLYQTVAGVTTLLDDAPLGGAAAYTLGLEYDGADVELLVDGVAVAGGVTTLLSSGGFGLRNATNNSQDDTSGWHMDNFRAPADRMTPDPSAATGRRAARRLALGLF